MKLLQYLPRAFKQAIDLSGEVHKAVITAVGKELDKADADIDELVSMLLLTTASDKWLEEWSSWFGITRRPMESDISLSTRLIQEILIAKTSVIPSMKMNIARFMNEEIGEDVYTASDISIFETYTKLMVYSSRGSYSGTHKYSDGVYWRHGVIEVIIPEEPSLELIRFINRIKAEGVKAVISVNGMTEDMVGYGILVATSEIEIEISPIVDHVANGRIFSSDSENELYSGKQTLWSEYSIIP